MKFFKLAILPFLIALLDACSNSTSPIEINCFNTLSACTDFEESPLVKIYSKGKTVTLGTTDSLAKADERPQMKVNFDYDFSIGRNEVTCNEFNVLMRFYSPSSILLDCDTIVYPATNVTYYDAILFANAKSMHHKLDTVYTYNWAFYDAKGHCTHLDGLTFNTNVDGYRLPTEAEWVFAASENWDLKHSWTTSNSDYLAHNVCSADSMATICDMAGNVMEWVYDWLGYYKDTTLSNFVGPMDGGNFDERIIKGGSYRDADSSINVTKRTDVYTVTSTSKAEYVGFRIARGTFKNPTWLNRNGKSQNYRIVALANPSDVRSLTSSFKSKLVFRNDISRNLAYIDYSEGSSTIIEIEDTINAHHPVISPDGKSVAFCTGLEGIDGPSNLYVRDLNPEGSNLVKLDVPAAAIPRWRVTAEGDTTIVYVDNAGNNKDNTEFFKKSTWQVTFSNHKFGTPQKILNGAYHESVSKDQKLALSGGRILRVHITPKDSALSAGRDSVWYNGEQACNASLSQDRANRVLFLDFGGKTGRKFLDTTYGTHEALLVTNAMGSLYKGFLSPKGMTYDHTEWASERSDIATFTFANNNGAHTLIAAQNTNNGFRLELVKGTELWHPYLWTEKKFTPSRNISIDSAGVYYNEYAWYNALELRVKMENFWFRKNDVTAAGIGSSRMMFGINEKKVTNENFLNMAYSAADMRGMYYIFENYLLNHVKNLKVLVVELSPDLLWYERDKSWDLIYNGVPGYKYDENHDFWVKSGPSEEFLRAVIGCPRPASALQHPYTLEEFQLPSLNWNNPAIFVDTTEMNLNNPNYKENFGLFKKIVQKANKKGIKVICLIAPQSPMYKKTGSYGVYGPKRSDAELILNEAKKMDLIWMDENKMGDHDYTESMAYNMDHLSGEGSTVLTSRLDSLFADLK